MSKTYSARGVWLASAPLHGSIRTRKSASTLKAKLCIGQLDFVSDNTDAQFSAYLQILSSSKPHSEVTSASHIPARREYVLKSWRLSDVLSIGSSAGKSRVTASSFSALLRSSRLSMPERYQRLSYSLTLLPVTACTLPGHMPQGQKM